jgi:hypothetical protein
MMDCIVTMEGLVPSAGPDTECDRVVELGQGDRIFVGLANLGRDSGQPMPRQVLEQHESVPSCILDSLTGDHKLIPRVYFQRRSRRMLSSSRSNRTLVASLEGRSRLHGRVRRLESSCCLCTINPGYWRRGEIKILTNPRLVSLNEWSDIPFDLSDRID